MQKSTGSPNECNWKWLPGHEGRYMVSDTGMVARICKPSIERAPGGHLRLNVCVAAKKRRVAPMVLETFVGPRPAGLLACHKDDNGFNNNLPNLRWDNHSGNMADLNANWAERRKAQKADADAKAVAMLREGHSMDAVGTALKIGNNRMVPLMVRANPVCRCGKPYLMHRADIANAACARFVPQLHATANKTRGTAHRSNVLTDLQVIAIRIRLRSGESERSIAKDYPISRSGINNIAKGKTWGWLV